MERTELEYRQLIESNPADVKLLKQEYLAEFGKAYKRSDKRTEELEEIENAKQKLLTYLNHNKRVYTVLRNVASSGMSRSISLVIAESDGEGQVSTLDYYARVVLGAKIDSKHGGIIARGAGMDMGFNLVYRLSSALYGDGYALKQSWL